MYASTIASKSNTVDETVVDSTVTTEPLKRHYDTMIQLKEHSFIAFGVAIVAGIIIAHWLFSLFSLPNFDYEALGATEILVVLVYLRGLLEYRRAQ